MNMYKAKKIVLFILVLIGTLGITGCGDKANQAQTSLGERSEASKKYEGKIVKQPSGGRGKEDGWYFVKNGKRSWIVDGGWLDTNGFKPADVIEISSVEFNSIPEDAMPAN